MANANFSLLAIASTLLAFLGYFVVFGIGIAKLRQHSQPAKWLLLGVSIWVISSLGSVGANMILSRMASPYEMGMAYLAINFISTVLHWLGTAFIIVAVFADRPQVFTPPPQDEQFEPRSKTDNPFAGPAAS